MSGKLHLFCPENDIALAFDKAIFTPPAPAMKLARSGSAIPFWWAEETDAVMCGGVNDDWLAGIQGAFGLPAAQPWNHCTDFDPAPWGWSAYVRKLFEHQGFKQSQLPTDEQLAEWRELSHRRTAARLCEMISSDFPAAVEVSDTDTAMAEVARLEGQAIVKAPWSSSGRGIIFAHSLATGDLERQIGGIIRKQGSVMIEKDAGKVLLNFGVLYNVTDEGAVEFVGYSVFETGSAGSYTGNLVGSQALITERIASIIGLEVIEATTDEVGKALAKIIDGRYSGPVGVDMLVYEDEGVARLYPAVEINLRRTMGFVAMSLGERILASARVGRLYVAQGDITRYCTPLIDRGKLHSGKLALNPPGGDFTFVLEVQAP